ncbi:MAG: hypothetical protein ABI288_06980 [Ginsengibacter sp.]
MSVGLLVVSCKFFYVEFNRCSDSFSFLPAQKRNEKFKDNLPLPAGGPDRSARLSGHPTATPQCV